MKGALFLDIDGTVTDKSHEIHRDVVDYLHVLQKDGWRLVFVTGRSYRWGSEPLSQLTFPYFFAVQNGSAVLEMPQKKIITKHYLKKDIIPKLESICFKHLTDFVIYSGHEMDDISFYRPKNFDKELLKYLAHRRDTIHEVWQEMDHFSFFPFDEFALFKCFGKREALYSLAQDILQALDVNAPVVKDPISDKHFICLGTNKKANKGAVVKEIKKMLMPEITISCGDDFNDITMLQSADISVVMETAPDEVLEYGDIVAKPASQNGIIEGIEKAINLSKG